jgi:hypothetical protein
MAGRIRTIKPEVLEDAKAAGLDDHSWRLWISLWMLADDHGCFHCHNERQVHGSIFWNNDTDLEQTRESIARLSRESLVTLYEVRGQRYGKITNWEKHQRVDHPGKPRVPQPNDPEATVITDSRETVTKPSRDSRESLAPDPDLRPPIPTSDPDPNTAREDLASVVLDEEGDAQVGLPGIPQTGPSRNEGWRQITNAWWAEHQMLADTDPSPNARLWKQLKRVYLVRANGDAGEVVKRIHNLFRFPPKFLDGSMPDFSTLEEHWEKLATPAGQKRNVRTGAARQMRQITEALKGDPGQGRRLLGAGSSK